jgi:TetR/AcrR family transcriptional regulator
MKKTRARAKDTEKKILVAAEKVFADKGLQGARVKDIAKLSQVNPALINYYFGSKEKLYRTVIEGWFIRVERVVMNTMEQDMDERERLHKLIESGIDVLGESPQISRILIREFVDGGDFTEAISKRHLRRIFSTADLLLTQESRHGKEYQAKVMHFMFSTLGSMILFFLMGPAIEDIWKRDAFSKTMIEERKREVIKLIFGGVGEVFNL